MLSISDRSFFYTYLAHTIKSGLHPKDALAAYLSDVSLPRKRDEELKRALFLFTKKSSLGSALSEARVVHPHEARLLIFAKQKSLPYQTILSALGDHLQKRALIAKKTRSLFLYPAILISEFVIVSAVLLFWLIPQLDFFFIKLNSKEPQIVRLLASAGKIINELLTIKNLPFAIVAIPAAWLIFIVIERRFNFRLIVSKPILRIPLAGQLLRLLASEEIFSILALVTKTSAKPDLREAFELAAECIKNPLYQRTLTDLARAAKEQTPLARILNQQKNRLMFPVIARRMLILGEKRGDTASAIHSAAQILSEELDAEVRRFTSLLEPILVISISIAVGGIGFMIQQMFSALQTAAIGG